MTYMQQQEDHATSQLSMPKRFAKVMAPIIGVLLGFDRRFPFMNIIGVSGVPGDMETWRKVLLVISNFVSDNNVFTFGAAVFLTALFIGYSDSLHRLAMSLWSRRTGVTLTILLASVAWLILSVRTLSQTADTLAKSEDVDTRFDAVEASASMANQRAHELQSKLDAILRLDRFIYEGQQLKLQDGGDVQGRREAVTEWMNRAELRVTGPRRLVTVNFLESEESFDQFIDRQIRILEGRRNPAPPPEQ